MAKYSPPFSLSGDIIKFTNRSIFIEQQMIFFEWQVRWSRDFAILVKLSMSQISKTDTVPFGALISQIYLTKLGILLDLSNDTKKPILKYVFIETLFECIPINRICLPVWCHHVNKYGTLSADCQIMMTWNFVNFLDKSTIILLKDQVSLENM